MDSSSTPENETPNQRQARLRRERRQAKLAAGGGDRLKKIIGVDRQEIPGQEDASPGPVTRSQSNLSQSTPSEPPPPYSEDAPDPDDVDISLHYEADRARRQRQSGQVPTNPFGMSSLATSMAGGSQDQQDPMMNLLSSFLNANMEGGANTSDPTSPNSPDQQMSTALAALLNGGNLPPGFQQQQQAQAQQTEEAIERYTIPTSTWRLIHFFSALILSLLALFSSPTHFTGSKVSRLASQGITNQGLGAQLWMYFAAVEAILLSTRLFLERGKPLGGMLGTVINILPGSIGSWIKVLARYATMGSSVVQDGLVVVWVVGMVGWWNGRSLPL